MGVLRRGSDLAGQALMDALLIIAHASFWIFMICMAGRE